MRHAWKTLVFGLLTLVCLASACGPNTFRVRRTILNPLHRFGPGDEEKPRPSRKATIRRKEPRAISVHAIQGPHVEPRALKPFCDVIEIPAELATPDALYVNWKFHTVEKEEVTKLSGYTFLLKLPDGRVIKGQLDRALPYRDMTQKISGVHDQPYQVVRDRQTGETTVYTAKEEVDNIYPFFSRLIRISFKGSKILSEDTAYVELIINGYGHEWHYHLDLTDDPEKGMDPVEEIGMCPYDPLDP